MLKPILFFLLALPFLGSAMENDSSGLNEELLDLIGNFGYRTNEAKLIPKGELDRFLVGIENLLNFGANANIVFEKKYYEKTTPLKKALYIRHKDPRRMLCELLLKRGADQNYNNSSALAQVCETGDLDLFALFLNHGADCHAIDSDNKTMLHHAAAGGSVAICEYLLQIGLDLFARDKYDNTLLHIAAKNKQNALCNWLLEKGLKLNIYNSSKETPLILASEAPHSIISDYSTHSRSEKIDSFKGSRQICQDMIAQQVVLSKKIHTLLGCIKKLAEQGDPVALTLYKQRNTLLRPYLQHRYCSLTQLLNDQKPYKNLEGFRKKAHEIKPDANSQAVYIRPIHEYQRPSDEYCGFLLPSAIQYTQNLSRPYFTTDWAQVEIQPLHSHKAQKKTAPAIAAGNNNNTESKRVTPNRGLAQPIAPQANYIEENRHPAVATAALAQAPAPAPVAQEERSTALPIPHANPQSPVPLPEPIRAQTRAPAVAHYAYQRAENQLRLFEEQLNALNVQQAIRNAPRPFAFPVVITQEQAQHATMRRTIVVALCISIVATIAYNIYKWSQNKEESYQKDEEENQENENQERTNGSFRYTAQHAPPI